MMSFNQSLFSLKLQRKYEIIIEVIYNSKSQATKLSMINDNALFIITQ